MSKQKRLWRVIFVCTLFFLASGCASSAPLLDTPIPNNQTPTLDNTNFTETPFPTPFATATTISIEQSDFIGYDFESGTQGWVTAEGQYKKAELSTTTQFVYAGNYALQLDTELFGSGSAEFAAHNNDDVYRHTEAVVYMNNSRPAGYDQPGPYDLTGKTFSCFVYLPDSLAVEGTPRAYIRLIAKDTKFANQFSQAVDITKDNTNEWLELSFAINSSSDTDFDPKQTNTLGVRLDSLDGSTVQYTGPIYIDNCSIK